MNIERKHFLIACLCALVAFGASYRAGAGMKCWENDEGITECGDAVPPEYAQKGHKEKSKSGVTVKTQERAKTEEELAAEKEEKERLAKEQAEADRLKAEQQARDRVLLATYMSEQDITMARDDRIAAIESRLKHTEATTSKLTTRLEELQTEAADLERNGKKVPKKLLGNIDKVRGQLETYQADFALRHQEKEDMVAKFAADIARFRELKSGTASQ